VRALPAASLEQRSALGHANLGAVAGPLLPAGRRPERPDDVADLARAAGLDVELADDTLDVLER
jgi:hypothetical protein